MEERKMSKKPIMTMVKSRKFHVFLQIIQYIQKGQTKEIINYFLKGTVPPVCHLR